MPAAAFRISHPEKQSQGGFIPEIKSLSGSDPFPFRNLSVQMFSGCHFMIPCALSTVTAKVIQYS
jgi:hypothetical protein